VIAKSFEKGRGLEEAHFVRSVMVRGSSILSWSVAGLGMVCTARRLGDAPMNEPTCMGNCFGDAVNLNLGKSSATRSIKLQNSSKYKIDTPQEPQQLFSIDAIRGSDGSTRVVETPITEEDHDRDLSVFHGLSSGSFILSEKRVFPYSSFGRLFVNKSKICSGAFVAENIFITAAHCVIAEDDVFRDLVISPNRIKDEAVEEIPVVGIYGYLNSGENFMTFPERDWVFLYTDDTPGAKYGWLSIAPNPNFEEGAPLDVAVAGYANLALCSYSAQLCVGRGSMAQDEVVASTEAIHNVRTGGGSSGGPVYTILESGVPTIVGIHVSTIDEDRKIAVLSSGFYDAFAKSRQKVVTVYNQTDNVVQGIVCLVHDHCDKYSFCSSLFGRCFRCDSCFGVGYSPPFDGVCPDKCIYSDGDDMDDFQRDALDVEEEGCLVTIGQEQDELDYLCSETVCLERESCQISEDGVGNLTYLEFNDEFIPHKYADVIPVSEEYFSYFDGDVQAAAQQRGYAAGIPVRIGSDLYLLAFGSPRVNSIGIREAIAPEQATPQETTVFENAPVVFGIFAAVASIGIIIAIYRRINYQYESERYQAKNLDMVPSAGPRGTF